MEMGVGRQQVEEERKRQSNYLQTLSTLPRRHDSAATPHPDLGDFDAK